ncbi:MAG: PIN domain-containing protein [Parahaliea sp.]
MKGLDTNVLIRYLAQDDPKQSRIATRFIEAECTGEDPCFIGHITLCELAWVLQSSYRLSAAAALEVIEKLMWVEGFSIDDPAVVWRAINDAKGSNADFPDHLVSRIAEGAGCGATVTFDKKAAKWPGFELLK